MCILVLGTSVSQSASAYQSYVAGRQSTGVFHADSVFGDIDFKGTVGSSLSSSLIGIMSTSGYSTVTGITPWLYQNGAYVSVTNAYHVYTIPQFWHCNAGACSKVFDPGQDTGYVFTNVDHVYHSMSWATSGCGCRDHINVYDYVYPTSGSPVLYQYTYYTSTYSDPSTYFTSGQTTVVDKFGNTQTVNLLQSGMESASSSSTAGTEKHWGMGFSDTLDFGGTLTTLFLSSYYNYALQGSWANITWDSAKNVYLVGGVDYVGDAHAKNHDNTLGYGAGTVQWYKTSGTPISNNALLWSP